jgi:hypothetical protein
MNKFLLAENPMRPEDTGLYIIHLLDPVAIIECFEGHTGTGEVEPGNIYKHFQFKNSDGIIEEWTLQVIHLFTTDFLEEPQNRAIKLLERAWRWYRAYMEWEDEKSI